MSTDDRSDVSQERIAALLTSGTPVDVTACAAWRRRARTGETRSEIAADPDVARSISTVGRHVAGRCDHDVDEPPVETERDSAGRLSRAECATIRAMAARDVPVPAIVRETGRSESSIHRHSTGECSHEFGDGDQDVEIMTDGGENVDRENESEPEGAIDNTFDEAEHDARETLAEAEAEHRREIRAGDVAIDLVTRQPLYVTGVAAHSLVEYYEREEFDLLSYKAHPYLPVRADDRVLNCVFVPRGVEGVHNVGKEYAYPSGRLARVPIERATEDESA